MRGARLFTKSLYFGLALTLAQPAFSSPKNCEHVLRSWRPLTLKALRESAAERSARQEQVTPKADFFEIEKEVLKEQIGELGPRALQDILPEGISFISTPAPTSPDAVAVNLVKEDYSFPVHVDIDWHGQRTSTAVYASLPRNKARSSGEYLVGPEYPAVYIHLHGGGTPTATGKNSMSIGEKLGHSGIPVLGPDLPGHGRATRKLKGLTTLQGQVDWMLKIAEKLIHPDVKIIVSGHSWGAEWAVFMHEQSLNPKYSRIVHYIPLSPPVDVSLEGDINEKVRFEEWFSHNFNEFAEISAPADLDFMRNLLVNGKDSDVGGLFAKLTDFDYRTPVLSKSELEARPPRDVIVGDYDLPVRVGRSMYDRAFESQSPKSTYTRIGMARTFKSEETGKPEMTGHNIFDAYIDGTTTPLVYKFLTDRALLYGTPQPPDRKDHDSPVWVIDQMFRNWSNFLGFREMVEAHVEYVEVPTPHLQALTSRKTEVDRYLKRVDEIEAAYQKEVDKRIELATEEFRKELGFKENMKLQRAQEEVALKPLSPEREAELREYTDAVEAIDKDMHKNFKDPGFEVEVEKLKNEYAPTLKSLQIAKFEDYRKILDPLVAQKNVSKEQAKLRSDLSRLHQRYTDALRAQQMRFGAERERRLSLLKAPEGAPTPKLAMRELSADRSEARRALLQKFIEGYAEREHKARHQAAEHHRSELERLPRPSYVTSVEQARQEKAEIDSMLNFTFQPSDDAELASLAQLVREKQDTMEAISDGGDGELSLEKHHATIRDIKAKRATALKKWSAMWKKGLFTSSGYNQALTEYEDALSRFQEAYYGYEEKKSAWLLSLKKAGQVTEENIVNMPSELKMMRQKKLSTREAFLKVSADLEAKRVQEALAGHLQGPEGAVKEAVRVAQELWSPESLAALKALEESYESRLRRHSLVQKELGELRHQYSTMALERGRKVPYQIERVVIYDHLNQPMADLLSELQSNPRLMKAFNRTLAKWADIVSEARLESESKDTGY